MLMLIGLKGLLVKIAIEIGTKILIGALKGGKEEAIESGRKGLIKVLEKAPNIITDIAVEKELERRTK